MKTPIPKILFIVQLPPPHHGVSAMNEYAIQNPLWKEQYSIRTLSLDFGQKLVDLGKITPGKLLGMMKFTFRLIRTLMAYRPDLVYFTIMPTGPSFYRDALFTMIIKLFCSKVIFHLHGKGIEEETQQPSLKKWLYKKTFSKVSVICLSETLTRDIKNIYFKKPFILPNGIQPIDVPTNISKVDLPVIIYLSNLVVSKGISVFLKSLLLLKEQNIPFRARIVGDSADFTIDQAKSFCIDNGLSEYVDVVGPKYNEEKVNELLEADIFVLPSLNECFPLTILEAMRSGLPVVATHVGGIPDMITHNQEGLLVKTHDVDDLAEKLKLLLTNSRLRESLGYNAMEKFRSNYTIDHFNNGLSFIFKKVITS
jgi:glycosyltransferase involved in cell wall biosynthesis